MRARYAYAWALCLFAADQFSKAWALHSLLPYQTRACCPGLNWMLAFNSGSAFSFLAHSGVWHIWFFLLFSLVMSVIIMVWIAQLDSLATRVEMMGFSLILAGALGNCVDRIRFGHVIDFIDVYISIYHWPVFNLADSAICVGGALLLYDAIVKRQNGLT